MEAQVFWNIIGNYNTHTWIAQCVLLACLVAAILFSYKPRRFWLAKLALGIANLFIAIGFFACYGTEPIQRYFALPLFLLIGILFIYESWHSKNDTLRKPTIVQACLLLLYLLFPCVSLLLGNTFPQMVTYVMPCPIASLSIAIYAGYERKNKVLLALLAIWGLTGVKSILFHVYEDIILLICGLYACVLLVNELRQAK